MGSVELEAGFEACAEAARRHEQRLGLNTQLRQWDKSRHLARLQRSECFAHAREMLLSHSDEGNAERFIGILLSQGYVQQVLNLGVSESDLGLTGLRRLAGIELGSARRPWHWSARVRVGVMARPAEGAAMALD